MATPRLVGASHLEEGAVVSSNSQDLNSLPRTASYIAGFQHRQGGANVSREQLIDQGMPPHQVNALITQAHEDEVLMRNFRRWIHCFSLIVCLLMPSMLGIMVWLVIEYITYRETDCSVPLQTWVYVVCIIVIFNSTCNRQMPTGSCMQRLFCHWTRDPNNPEPLPLRIQLYNLAVTLFIFLWNGLGLCWVIMDGKKHSAEYPPCKDVAPGLWKSVQVYSCLNLTFTVFMYVNMVGFARLLRIAMHRGLLRTSDAAPPGSLEKSTEAATMSDPLLTEQPSCSICLEDFSAGNKPAVKTKGCQHVFHKQCLQGWLQVNRTCPLCRLDLADHA